MEIKRTIGLVLSGGGYRGIAHIGAIRAMEEHGLEANYVSGTSAGAIVGALYAAGYSWQEMLDVFQSISIFSFSNYALRKPGLIDSDKFYETFLKYFPDDNFKVLERKLFVTATDLIGSGTKIFHEGELIRPLLASSAVPGVFSPIAMDETLYCDGGVTNNFPVEPLQIFCDAILGVYVNPLEKVTTKDLNSTAEVVERAYLIIRATASKSKFTACDVLIVPPELNQYGILKRSNMDKIFQLGYEEAKKRLLESGLI